MPKCLSNNRPRWPGSIHRRQPCGLLRINHDYWMYSATLLFHLNLKYCTRYLKFIDWVRAIYDWLILEFRKKTDRWHVSNKNEVPQFRRLWFHTLVTFLIDCFQCWSSQYGGANAGSRALVWGFGPVKPSVHKVRIQGLLWHLNPSPYDFDSHQSNVTSYV